MVGDLLNQVNENWIHSVKNVRYDSTDKVQAFDASENSESHRKDYLSIDNCDFPWHLIRKWEIKCEKYGSTWEKDVQILNNSFGEKINLFKNELESVKSKKHINIISIQDESQNEKKEDIPQRTLLPSNTTLAKTTKTTKTTKTKKTKQNKLRIQQSETDSNYIS